MDPVTALIVIATIVAMRPFFEFPGTAERRRILRAAGYQEPTSVACLYLLLLPALLLLWWWYALATDQLLLGVIPTVGTAASVLALVADRQAPGSAPR